MANRDVLMTNEERAQKITWILMDVDGTLTDGSLLVFPDGEELKTYNVRDGMGILLAHLAGFKTGIITGKTSKPLEIRSKKLKMDEIHQGIVVKKPVLDDIMTRNGLVLEQVAYIGDDLGDLDVIKSVGFAAAVADAHDEVKKHSHFICRNPGGRGAVREFIEFILTKQNKWEKIQENVKNLKPKTNWG
jgi:3-deoxy-D-manno-octulosonate 8-phosphate phosphatase (KDO 8-P phosphatase)